jgi:carbonic anhydrase
MHGTINRKLKDLFVFRFPMEMHIVHRKQSYGSVQEALNHSDGLSVLAFFFQVSTFLSLANSLICSHCARLSD